MTRMTGMRAFAAAMVVAAPLGFASKADAATAVGLELVLLIDVSGSVDTGEYNLQKGGYVAAFQSAAVQNAILNSQLGKIAVTYVEWSGASQQAQLVNWTLIDSAASANAFAAAIAGTSRAYSGLTAVGSAINYGAGLFANDYDGLRKVMDVSGDGETNDGAGTIAARDAAVAAGITINGLAIGPASLLTWYTNNVIGGPGAFAIGVNDFADFAAAIQQKLVKEITGTPVPEPTTLALLGFGLAALGMAARRRKAA